MSVNFDLLTAVGQIVTDLAITFNSVPLPVEVLKAPALFESVSALPRFAVHPVGTITREPVTMMGDWEYVYPVGITRLAAGNRDMIANLDLYLQWQEQVIEALKSPPLPGYPYAWKIDLRGPVPTDPGLLKIDIDGSTLQFDFHVYQT